MCTSPAITQVPSSSTGSYRGRVGVVLVGDLADQLLGEVLDRQRRRRSRRTRRRRRPAGCSAPVELAQRVGQRHRRRDQRSAGRMQAVAGPCVGARRGQDVQQVHDADHLVVVVQHRVAGVARASSARADVAEGVVGRARRRPATRGIIACSTSRSGEVEDPVQQHRQLVGAGHRCRADSATMCSRSRTVAECSTSWTGSMPQRRAAARWTPRRRPGSASRRRAQVRRWSTPPAAARRARAGDREVLGEQLAEEHLHERREQQRERPCRSRCRRRWGRRRRPAPRRGTHR